MFSIKSRQAFFISSIFFLGEIFEPYFCSFTSLEYKLMKSRVKWFYYDKIDNKFYICLCYEKWMKDYENK